MNMQATVRSLLSEEMDIPDDEICSKDEVDDAEVDTMLAIILDEYPLEQNS